MKYNANFFCEVLKNSFHYEEVTFPFCRALKLSSIDAFRYVVYSNSGYLDLSQIENRLIIRKDFFRIFNQAEQESIQHGLFDGKNCIFKATPNLFFDKYPYILNGDKYIVFLEYNPKAKIGEPPYYPLLRNLHAQIIDEGLNPFDFVVTLVPSNNNPKDLESFFEYCMVEEYRRKGYLSDSQIPFYYGVGTPDAAAYSERHIHDEIFEYLGIAGASTIDLMCLKFQTHKPTDTFIEDSCVFEMKTGSIDGSQINKYKEMKIFKRAYEVIPHKENCSDYAGLIRYDSFGTEIKTDLSELDSTNQQSYYRWLELYVKCLLITNFDDDRFSEFKAANRILNTIDLISVLKKKTYKEIIDEIMEE